MTAATDVPPAALPPAEVAVLDDATRARFVVDSGWFDAEWYAERHRDDPEAVRDPLAHWLGAGSASGAAPGPRIDALAAQRGERVTVTGIERDAPSPDDPQLRRDIAVVEASGLFDEAYYLSQLDDDEDLDGATPLEHFCRLGWRELLRPCRGFDVWWYWSTHLDPAGETLDPFVHYLVAGRAAGLTGRPTSLATTGGWRHPDDQPVRRICLFAGFDAGGVLDETVVDYVRDLSRFADVYYLCDSYLPPAELAKLDGIVRGAWAIRHGCYDFGSYAMLAHELVGWDTVSSYDELLLVNDSCYLLRPLDDVFATMDARAADWWGLQATKGIAATRDAPSNAFTEPIPLDEARTDYLPRWEDDDVYDFHVGSYFLAYRRPVLDDPHFARLLESVHRQRGKAAIIHKYEIGLTHTLLAGGHAVDTYLDAVYPFHPLFTAWHFELIAGGFPLLKRYLIYQNHYDVPDLHSWRERVAALVPEADLDPVEAHLHRAAPHDRLTRSFAIRTTTDGSVSKPELLVDRAFRRADKQTPKDPTWWAFPVCPIEGTLPANSRAILEEVRHDPAITKVVLTRAHRIDLDGAHVQVLPLLSPEGQDALLRSGYVFMKGQPRRTVGERLSPDHRQILVRDGLSVESGRTVLPRTRSMARLPAARWHAALTASPLDQLVVVGANYPIRYPQGLRTGVPAHDFLVRPTAELPPEIADQEQRLRAELDGRPLVLLAVASRGRDRPAYRFAAEEVTWLAQRADRTGVVLGVREHSHDLDRPYAAQLPFALDLSHHRYPLLHAVLRASDAVLTDYASAAFDLRAATGRPVVSFVPDLADLRVRLALDLEHVFPGPVCRTFAELAPVLDALLEPLPAADAERYERRARLLADPPDGASAARVVALLREEIAAAETGAVA
ncbi:rhamnan synthesis F family protein [Nocardioides sp. GXZ039]|uniref:rhamnan synthesis F family protein n=1 Tax=Nocardioides sp. GXZ039 TaxID=3136018 RepID=UPI0030F3F9B5